MAGKTITKDTQLPEQQYVVVVELNAPIEQCFIAASSEEAMMQWVPGPKSIVYDHSKASEPYGPGSSRLVTLKSGMTLVECIHISDKPGLVGYYIPTFGFVGDLFINNYQGRMNFEAIDATHTRLTWIGYFDCSGLQKITEPLMRMVMKNLISTMANNMKKMFDKK